MVYVWELIDCYLWYKIAVSNGNDKPSPNAYSGHQEFYAADYVMIPVYAEHYPKDSWKGCWTFLYLSKINSGAYFRFMSLSEVP